MSTQAPPTPLQERDRLQAELRSAYGAADTVRARIAELEAQQREEDKFRLAAYQAKARGHAEADKQIEDAEATRIGLAEELDATNIAYEGAGRARVEVEQELARLYEDELAAFAAEANERTARAAEAFRALETPYRDLFAAWQAATAQWAPLVPAIRTTMSADEDEQGIWRDDSANARAAAPPPFPLPNPDAIFARPPVARPPALRRRP